MYRDDDIRTLIQLGLTLLQAKAYLTLCIIGSATMGAISKNSSIARQDVYRVMPTLQKLGIVEKVVKTPATYQALPIKEGLSLLLQQKQEDFDTLQKKAHLLIKNRQMTKENATSNGDENDQFMIIQDQTLLFQKFERANVTAQMSIDCSCRWPRMKWLISLCNCKDDLFTLAMARGVKIRLLTETRGQDSSVDKNIAGMSKNALFEVRFVPGPIPLQMVLYDGKEAYTSMSTSEETDLPHLWSNNPHYVWLMKNQFDGMWNQASKFRQAIPEETGKKR